MVTWHGINLLYSASGLFVGALVGLTGVGGGSLMTPLLVLLFGIHPSTAVGTDLLYAGLTKIAGTAVHGRNHSIDWRITGRLAAGSVPATILMLAVLARAGKNDAAMAIAINTTLGIAVLLTAIALMFRRRLMVALGRYTERLGDRQRHGLTIALGFVLGVLVSVSSVGAGAIGVTVLILLYPSLPTVRVVGSDIAHAVPLTLLAGSGHWLVGSVDFALLGSLLIGSVPGIIIASQFARRVPDGVLRPLLATTLAIVGLKLVF